MYLSRIQIKNFRNFSDLNLILGPTTVIVGENRVGKSNLLAGLRLLFDPNFPDASRPLSAEDFWDGLDKPFNKHEIEISAEISGFEGNDKAESLFADYLINNEPRTAKITYKFRPRTAFSPTADHDYEYVIYGGNDEKNKVPYDWKKGFPFWFYQR